MSDRTTFHHLRFDDRLVELPTSSGSFSALLFLLLRPLSLKERREGMVSLSQDSGLLRI